MTKKKKKTHASSPEPERGKPPADATDAAAVEPPLFSVPGPDDAASGLDLEAPLPPIDDFFEMVSEDDQEPSEVRKTEVMNPIPDPADIEDEIRARMETAAEAQRAESGEGARAAGSQPGPPEPGKKEGGDPDRPSEASDGKKQTPEAGAGGSPSGVSAKEGEPTTPSISAMSLPSPATIEMDPAKIGGLGLRIPTKTPESKTEAAIAKIRDALKKPPAGRGGSASPQPMKDARYEDGSAARQRKKSRKKTETSGSKGTEAGEKPTPGKPEAPGPAAPQTGSGKSGGGKDEPAAETVGAGASSPGPRPPAKKGSTPASPELPVRVQLPIYIYWRQIDWDEVDAILPLDTVIDTSWETTADGLLERKYEQPGFLDEDLKAEIVGIFYVLPGEEERWLHTTLRRSLVHELPVRTIHAHFVYAGTILGKHLLLIEKTLWSPYALLEPEIHNIRTQCHAMLSSLAMEALQPLELQIRRLEEEKKRLTGLLQSWRAGALQKESRRIDMLEQKLASPLQDEPQEKTEGPRRSFRGIWLLVAIGLAGVFALWVLLK